MNIYIIIPAYNEESKIAEVLEAVKSLGYLVVVVDDGSSDRTAEIAQNFNGITALRHIVNRGQGAALKTGMDYALSQGADVIVHFDADGQMSVGEIPKLVQTLIESRADVILGSRFLGVADNIPWLKKYLLKGAIFFTYFISGIKLTDTHNGFRAMNRKAAEAIEITQDRMAHASEILDQIARKDLKWLEAPVTIEYTDYSIRKGQRVWNCVRICVELILGKWTQRKSS
ncbi:MAG: glycosyltransferase family 2 protein [Parcubacteria group bacterium]|nr:glycosyltransferase family 2 protein [Parcubacteria group bacterium]